MNQLQRLPEWSSLLRRYMMEATKKEFSWGSFDCAMNAADSVLCITGVDLAAQFRGTYSTEEEAYEVLRSHGYADMLAVAEDHLPKASSAQ